MEFIALQFCHVAYLLLLQFITLVRGQNVLEPCIGETDETFYNGTFYIRIQEHADQLSGCTHLSGHLNIETTSFSIILRNIEVIRGDLRIQNSPNLWSFAAPNLTSLTGSLSLNNLPALVAFYTENLQGVYNVVLYDLPLFIQSWNQIFHPNFLASTMDSLTVFNTGLADVISTSIQEIDTIWIDINAILKHIEFPNLATVASSLIIVGQGAKVDVRLRELVQAGYVTIQKASSIAMQSLQVIDQNGLYIADTTVIELDLPYLELVKGTLTLSENPSLVALNLKALGRIEANTGTKVLGNLRITGLEKPIALNFMNLTIVESSIYVQGSFKSLSFPKIDHFTQYVLIDSTTKDFDCTTLDGKALNSSNYLYSCFSDGRSSKDLTSEDYSEDFLENDSGDTSGSSDEKNRTIIIATVTIIFPLILLAGCCYTSLKRIRRAEITRARRTEITNEDLYWSQPVPGQLTAADSLMLSRIAVRSVQPMEPEGPVYQPTRSVEPVHQPTGPTQPVQQAQEVGFDPDHDLPMYRARGLPGEVPPTYKANEN